MALFRRDAAIPPEFLAVLRLQQHQPASHAKKRLAQSADALRSELHTEEVATVIFAVGWGILAVTDGRLIHISRGTVSATFDPMSVGAVDVRPDGPGYSVTIRAGNGSISNMYFPLLEDVRELLAATVPQSPWSLSLAS